MNYDLELLEELYELMKEALAITKLGYIEDDYTKTIYLDIGGGTLSYDPYYNYLQFDEEDVDEDKIPHLIQEIRRRLDQIEDQIKDSKKKAVEKTFTKPLQL